MSLKYHGVIVPEGTDLADAPKSFRDLADFGNTVGVFATLSERDAWASPPDGAICVVLKSSGVSTNVVQQYTVGIGWRSYDPSPIGLINAYAGAAAPSADWLLCNGQVVPAGSVYDALRALVGANVPDLRDRFVLGAGPKAVAATGGAATVTLSEAQLAAHTHASAVGNDTSHHTHNFTTNAPGGHNHTNTAGSSGNANGIMFTAASEPATFKWQQGTGALVALGTYDGATALGGDHTHAGVTSGVNGNHVHSLTVNNAGGNAAHENMPPYYVLSYIIRAR